MVHCLELASSSRMGKMRFFRLIKFIVFLLNSHFCRASDVEIKINPKPHHIKGQFSNTRGYTLISFFQMYVVLNYFYNTSTLISEFLSTVLTCCLTG